MGALAVIVTCRRESCGRQFGGISQAQLDEILDLDEKWQCPACGFSFDPYEDPKETGEPTFDIGPIVQPKKARA